MKSTVKTLYGHSQKDFTGISHIPVQVFIIFAVDRAYIPAEMPELIVGKSEKQIPELQMISIALGAKRYKTVGSLFQ